MAYVESRTSPASPTSSRPAGTRRDPAPRLRLDLERLRRQHRDALRRGPGRRPPAAVLRRHQAGQRADGACLRPPLPPALHRPALLHRLRPLGPARHGADDLRRRRSATGRPIRLFNEGRHSRDFTYRRRHRRGGDPRRRPHRPPDPAWDPAAPRPGTSDAPFRIYNIGNGAPVAARSTSSPRSSAALGRPAIRELAAAAARRRARHLGRHAPASRPRTGWRPATPVDEGVRRFVAWFRDFYGR